MKICLLLESQDPPIFVGNISNLMYNEFISPIAAQGHDVEMVDKAIHNLNKFDFILLSSKYGFPSDFQESDETIFSEFANRIILLHCMRGHGMSLAKKYGFAGVIEQPDYFYWKRNYPDNKNAFWMVGKRKVAEKIGSKISKLQANDIYCLFGKDDAKGLPNLLAIYLENYE